MTRTCMMTLLVVGCLLTGACTTDRNDSYYAEEQAAPVDDTPDRWVTQYDGQWTVDGQAAETGTLELWHEGTNYYLACMCYPFQRLTERFLPEMKSFSIVFDLPLGTPFNAAERLLLSTIASHGDSKNCLELALSTRLRSVGYSDSMRYFELPFVDGAAYRYLPFVVQSDTGDDSYAVVLCVVPNQSTMSLDLKDGLLRYVLTVNQVEIIGLDGQTTVQQLSDDMLLQFTGTVRNTGGD